MAGPQAPLTCVNLAEFKANPGIMYDLIHSGVSPTGTAQLQYDQNRINVMSTIPTDDQDKHNRILRAHTLEELEIERQQLKSRPFLMVVAPYFSETKSYGIVRVTTKYNGTYAMLVNPENSMISTVIDAKFEQAKESLLKGHKYCIELNFNSAIANWFQCMVGSTSMCPGIAASTCKYGRVYITNHSTYQHIFDVHKWSIMCLCGLCWLSSAPCYMLYRHQTCDDFRYKFKDIPVALRTMLASGEVADMLNDDALRASAHAEPVIQTQPPPYPGLNEQQQQQHLQQQQNEQLPWQQQQQQQQLLQQQQPLEQQQPQQQQQLIQQQSLQQQQQQLQHQQPPQQQQQMQQQLIQQQLMQQQPQEQQQQLIQQQSQQQQLQEQQQQLMQQQPQEQQQQLILLPDQQLMQLPLSSYEA